MEYMYIELRLFFQICEKQRFQYSNRYILLYNKSLWSFFESVNRMSPVTQTKLY